MITLTEAPIDPAIVWKLLSARGAGSIVMHIAVVKPVVDNKQTRGIRFTPLAGL